MTGSFNLSPGLAMFSPRHPDGKAGAPATLHVAAGAPAALSRGNRRNTHCENQQRYKNSKC